MNEQIVILQNVLTGHSLRKSAYYDALSQLGLLKRDYKKYMTTSPIDADAELARMDECDLDGCAALLTMMIAEDNFVEGAFDERLYLKQPQKCVLRMLYLIEGGK